MEHDDKPLPLPMKTLSFYAQKCNLLAKALHYKEQEFSSNPSRNTADLITYYNGLQQPDEAIGVLKYALQNFDIQLKETWHEKLGRWDEALAAYEAKLTQPNIGSDQDFELNMGRMRCLHALGEWETLSELTQDKWERSSDKQKKDMANIAASAAWSLSHWELLDDYLAAMNEESADGLFFKAVLSIHRSLIPDTLSCIVKAREIAGSELATVVGESYTRAYRYLRLYPLLLCCDLFCAVSWSDFKS
jgi:FKBP12-rapamycin complex-associated protein